ncbi:MAG: FAD-dependent oxidoreductase, partial [Clostridia bacterium]|nr:FAD-dependent oxidoreductase [Clostridia bacterium]
DGIIVAGRSISGSREAMASYRVTGNCCQMGENAGYILAEAIRTGKDLRDVRMQFALQKS